MIERSNQGTDLAGGCNGLCNGNGNINKEGYLVWEEGRIRGYR